MIGQYSWTNGARVKDGKSCWERFDLLAQAMVEKKLSFDDFVRQTKADFLRIARGIERKKALLAWYTIDDLVSNLVASTWHYVFQRKCRNGSVGFDASKYRSAGAFIRWKVRHRAMKDLAKARGENQHTRRGPRAPEYLSKTGEYGGLGGVPELAVPSTAEASAQRSARFQHLRGLCEDSRELSILRAIEAAGGDEESVVQCLVADPEASVSTAADARRAVGSFLRSWTSELGALPVPRAPRKVEKACHQSQ